MKNEDRIVELLAELDQKQDVFAEKLDNVVGEIRQMKSEIRQVKDEVHHLREDMQEHHAKTNAGLQEVRLSVIRLADI